MFCMRAMQTKDDAWRSFSFFFSFSCFLIIMMDMMISNIRAPRLLFRFFFLVSVFPFGLLGFRLVIRSYGVEISWACACRITSFLIYFGAERIRVKLLSFFFDTRRDDQPTSTTFWIYRLEKQLSLALSSGIFISMVLFFLGTEQILSSVRDLERGRADVIHSLYADQFASLFALIICIL